MELVDYKKGLEICKKYHYTQTLPQGVKYIFYFSGSGWEGVVCYGLGANKSLNKYNVIELQRCAFSPKPKEVKTSKFIIECDKYILKQGYNAIVSYYDASLQKNTNGGYLYLYSRYDYYGTTQKSHSYEINGKYANKRTVWSKYKKWNIENPNQQFKNEFEYAKYFNIPIFYQEPKKRFVKLNKEKQNIVFPKDWVKQEWKATQI